MTKIDGVIKVNPLLLLSDNVPTTSPMMDIIRYKYPILSSLI